MGRVEENLKSMIAQDASEEEKAAYLRYEQKKAKRIPLDQHPMFDEVFTNIESLGIPSPRTSRAAGKALTGEKILKYAPAIGATALTLAAPQVGIPARIGLAILGGAGGKGFQLDKGADADIAQNILDMGLAGAEEGAYELGGEAAFRVGKRVLGPPLRATGKGIRKLIKPPEMERGATEAIETIQRLSPPPKKGNLGTLLGTDPSELILTPGQATTSGIIDFAENMGEYGILGGRMRQFKDVQQGRGISALEDVIAGIRQSGMGADEVGDIVIDTLNKKHSAFIGSFKGRYKALDELSEGATVDFDPIVEFLGSIKEGRVAKEIGSSASGNKLIDAVLNDESIKAGNVGFMQADDLRKRLWKESEMAVASNRKDVAIGLSKKLQSMIDAQMDKAGRKLPKDVIPTWRQIRREYKAGIEPFNKKLVRQLMNMDEAVAEDVVRKVFTPNITTRNLANVKELAGDKMFSEMSGIWLEQTTKKIFRENEGLVPAGVFANALKQMDGRNGKNLALMFDKETTQNLKGISKYLTLTQQGIGGGTGKLFIQMKQAGQFTLGAGMIFGGAQYDSNAAIGGGIVIIGGPALIAQAFSRPSIGKLLIRGARLPRGSPQLITLAARLNREIKRVEKDMQRDEQKRQAPPSPLEGLATSMGMGR